MIDLKFWGAWALILLAQNFSFTFVSRARNSGSLSRHVKAAFASNGVWFLSQVMATTTFLAIISGRFGWKMAVFAAFFYTLFTVTGSVAAHYFSLKNEKGKGAVGANKKYAQIPVAEWEQVKTAALKPQPRHYMGIDYAAPPIPGQGAKI